jgi:hypothetical protein
MSPAIGMILMGVCGALNVYTAINAHASWLKIATSCTAVFCLVFFGIHAHRAMM